jgi:nickel-type superoxide dismutase maturation protease
MRWPLLRVAVAERSMEPALRPGDWLLVWRGLSAARPTRVRPGQVVIARHPGRPTFLLVKRVVRRLPDGWWLLSDNPAAGAVDSRSFGPVPPALIEGRLVGRYWPIRHR